MQRYLRRGGSNPPELFVWTGALAKKAGFEEVWAADAADAAKSPAAPQLDSVGRTDLLLLGKKELAAYAAFRLMLELDPDKLNKGELIERICRQQGWEVPVSEERVVERVVSRPLEPLAMDHKDVLDSIEGAASTVAAGSMAGGEACVLMMFTAGFVMKDPFDMARAIDKRALELMNTGGEGVGSGERTDGVGAG